MAELETGRGRGRRMPEPAMAALVAIACLALVGLLAVAGGRGPAVNAQVEPEASPVANPTTGECQAADGMMASPMAGMDMAMAEGTPAALEGTPETGATADDAVAAAENLIFCWNAGDLEAVLSLVTPNLLQDKFGVGSAEEAADALTAMAELPQYTLLGIGNVQSYDDGRASVDLIYLLGEYQYVEARWFMVMAGEQLLVDEEELLPAVPEGETNTIIPFAVADDESPALFGTATSRQITTSDIVTLHGVNSGTEQRVFNVVQVGDDPTAGTPAADAFDPTAGEFVGTLSLAGGEEGDMALVGLDAGIYAIYDMAVEGSLATLIVAEPAA